MIMAASLRKTVLILALLFHQAAAARRKAKSKGTCSYVHKPVNILVTRHGLSCANVIDKFSKGWVASKMHAMMKDPLLSASGRVMTSAAADETRDWLDQKNMTVDAVLASHLARAMETAALQYPGIEVQGVPYISESGLGLDNKPRSLFEQKKILNDAVENLNLNTQWIERYPNTNGNWDRFIQNFLAFEYLPKLFGHQSASSTEAVTLAAVTHSNFMSEGEIKQKCGHLYPIDSKTKKRKANNNQVVMIPYLWETESCSNGTLTRRLVDAGSSQCELVATGTSLYDRNGKIKPLCKRDVGQQCFKEFADAKAWVPPTLEKEMDQLSKQHEKVRLKSMELKQHRGELDKHWRAIHESNDERKDQKMQIAVKAIHQNDASRLRMAEEMEKLAGDFDALKATECWLGENPAYTSSEFN